MENNIGGEWDRNLQIVEPGYYKASVKEAEAKISQSGNKMVELLVELKESEYDGITIYHHLVFKPDEADNFNNRKRMWFQESAGLKYSLNQAPESLANVIIGRKVTVKVNNRQQGDQTRNQIVGVHPYNWEPEDSTGANAASGVDVDLSPDEDFF